MLSLAFGHPNPFLQNRICCSSTSSLQQIEKKSPPSNPISPRQNESEPFPAIGAAKRVVLVRHGQSTWNEEGRIQGSSDFAVLTQKGEAQAETSRQMLLGDTFHVCFHSPLIRSKRTAEIIWGDRNEEMIPESDMREIDLYSFQGLLKHEGKAKFGDAYRQWQKDAPNFNIDGHYPVRELWARARNCWHKILKHEGKSVLVVAHNAVNQALVATAIGLDTNYFRILLQSNCGVSVLDFTPRPDGGSPYICLNRLNQTPNSPIATASSSVGRKTSKRVILVCHGATQNDTESSIPDSGDEPLNMLGVIQSQKTAELLLDLKVSSIICSPQSASVGTATVISKGLSSLGEFVDIHSFMGLDTAETEIMRYCQRPTLIMVQEAADCLGADCVPRYVEIKQMQDLQIEHILHQLRKDSRELPPVQSGRLNSFEDVLMTGFEDVLMTGLWDQAGNAWNSVLHELSDESEPEKNVVVIGHPTVHIALIGHCLNLSKDWMGAFHLDAGSISVIDFPDGPTGRAVVRCVNYTAHLGRWSIPVTRSTVDDEEF